MSAYADEFCCIDIVVVWLDFCLIEIQNWAEIGTDLGLKTNGG